MCGGFAGSPEAEPSEPRCGLDVLDSMYFCICIQFDVFCRYVMHSQDKTCDYIYIIHVRMYRSSMEGIDVTPNGAENFKKGNSVISNFEALGRIFQVDEP